MRHSKTNTYLFGFDVHLNSIVIDEGIMTTRLTTYNQSMFSCPDHPINKS